jgi:hypothetical protein
MAGMKPGDPGYWEWRKKVGRPKALKSPEQLWRYACEYFERVDTSPFYKQDFIRGGESAGTKVNLECLRPYTWEGLEMYLREKSVITDLDDYKGNSEGAYTEFQDTIRAIAKVIYDRNFSGAAVNALNANLIARQLGLAEKTINENKNTEAPFDYSKLSQEALEEIAKQADAGKNKS